MLWRLYDVKSAKTSMGRLRIAGPGVLGMLVLLSCAWPGPVVAQSSASLRIGGVVHGAGQITIQPQAGHDRLDLANGVDSAVVATVTEKSNSATSYDLKLTSLNARSSGVAKALLKETAGATNVVAYAIAYGAPGQETPVSLDSQGTARVGQINAKTSEGGTIRNIKVTVGQGAYAPDAYSDMLILTIASK
jgi:hypothetical protein